EVEVPGRLLLEPEPVVVRRVLEELRRLLEHVVLGRRLGSGRARGGRRLVGPGLVVDGRRRVAQRVVENGRGVTPWIVVLGRRLVVTKGGIAVRLRRAGLGRLDRGVLGGGILDRHLVVRRSL